MTDLNKDILDAATLWFVRLERDDASASAWEAFTDWLEENPEHGRHYDAAVLGDYVFDTPSSLDNDESTPELPEPANDNRPGWYAGFATAAAVLIAIFWLWPVSGGPQFQRFETAPGESRQIALGEGTMISLNGGTEILVDMAGERRAQLLAGEALFTIEHDARRPFIVELDDERLVDAGTVFNVVRDNGDYSVSVAEGKVILNPETDAAEIMPGEQLAGTIGKSEYQIIPFDPSAIGGWAIGQLSFNNAALSQVASELERSFGTTITVADKVRGLRFTGTLQIGNGERAALESLAGLSGVKANAVDDGWRLSP